MLPEHSLRLMVADDLAVVLSWRNHIDIRRFMYTTDLIDWDDHCRWFSKASLDTDRHLLIYEAHGQAQGFVNLSWKNNVADWGFYVAPDAPKGCGRELGRLALTHAFNEINLHKVCGQALMFNLPSIKFHTHLGFQQEGVLREQHFDGEVFHSVVCFGLLRNEWLAR